MKRTITQMIMTFFICFFCIFVADVNAGIKCVYGNFLEDLIEVTSTNSGITAKWVGPTGEAYLGGAGRVEHHFTTSTFENGCPDPIYNDDGYWDSDVGLVYVLRTTGSSTSIDLRNSIEIFEGGTPISGSLEELDCDGVFTPKVSALVDETLNFMKYLAPVLVIIFSVIDFIKAVSSQDKDQLKKAQLTATKRLLIAVALYFIPIIINILLDLFDITSGCGY